MSTPLSLLIFNIVALGTLQFLGVLAVGFFLWQWIAPRTTKTWSVVAAPIVGAGVASAWLNLLAPLIGWRPAVWIFFGFCLFVLYHLRRRWRATPDDVWWPAMRKWGPVVLVAVLALSFTSGSFDMYWHLSFMAELANGLVPPPHPMDPTLAFTYHYGFEILAGATHFVGWPLPFAAAVWQGVLQAALLGAIWLWLCAMDLSGRRAATGTLLVAFVGTLGFLVRPFRSLAPEILGTIYPFHNTTMVHSLYLVTFMKSTLPALGILALALAAYHARVQFERKRLCFLVPILLAAVALSNEEIFVLVVPFIFLGLLFEPSTRGARWAIIATGAAGLILAAQEPGLIHDLVKGFFGHDAARDLTTFVWRPTTTFPTFYESPMRLHTSLGFFRFLLEYGARLFLAFFALRAWKKSPPVARALLLASVIMFLIPFLFDYPPSTQSIFRVWIPAFLIFVGYGARELFERPAKLSWWKIVAAPALVLGGVASTLLVNIPQLGLYWSGDAEAAVPSAAFWIPSVDMKTRLPAGSVLGTTIPVDRATRHEVYEQWIVFGAPMQLCLDAWGAKSKDVCEAFLTNPNQDTLRAFGVTHLLTTPAFVAAHGSEAWFGKNLMLVRRFDPPAWARQDQSSYLLYQVRSSL